MRTVRAAAGGTTSTGAAGRARSGLSAFVGRTFWLTFAVTTATYGRKIAAAPKTHVYQPYGVMTTMRMKHRMRIPIMMRYRRERRPASSRGARGSDVAEAGRLELFTVLPDYAADAVRSPERASRPGRTQPRSAGRELVDVGEEPTPERDEDDHADNPEREAHPSEDGSG